MLKFNINHGGHGAHGVMNKNILILNEQLSVLSVSLVFSVVFTETES